jgi:uncharacterized repeat protein (TIGR01451 family)
MSKRTVDVETVGRLALAVLGLVAVVTGVVTILVVHPLADALPSSFALVVLAGLLAVVSGLWLVRRRYRSRIRFADVPDVEAPIATPAPGTDVDSALHKLTRYREGTIKYREQLQDRLGETAVAVLRNRANCSREEAIRRLEAGDWTDDASAAAFFAGGSPPGRSLSERLFGSDESAYEEWVHDTVDAIADLADVTVGTAAEPPDGGILERLGASERPAAAERRQYPTEPRFADADRLRAGVVANDPIRTGHWTGVAAFALLAAGVGVLLLSPGLLLVSVIGVAFAGYARAATPPPVADLEVERRLSERQPRIGEPVEVTVVVRNTGDSFLPDLRLVDRVPEPMSVVEGSPRIATGLRAGSSATFTYTAVAERGVHEWPLVAVARDASGSIEREALVEVDATLACVPSLATTSGMPVRSKTSLYSGQVDTALGGSGLEFFAVREYREGDPMKRIDWKRHARTGELATIDYRQERSANVVLLFDARESAYVSPALGDPHALDKSVDAAIEVFASLFDTGNLVGLAAFDTIPCWLAPGADDEHRERARQLFTEHPALSSLPPAYLDLEGGYIDPMTHVRRQLSPDAQVMLFSPLGDDYTEEVARRLDSAGHPVTVISPDPTATRTVGQRLARVERAMRVASLRERGVRVIDWGYDDHLGIELERAEQRWAV